MSETSSTAPEVVLHLGAHKTGTSLIQKYLRDKLDLLHPLGLRFINRTEMNALIGWGKPLMESPNLLRERIAEDVADEGATVVVGSMENALGIPIRDTVPNLYPEAGPRVEALARSLAPFDTRILYYIRPQADFLESYYLQMIHQGKYFTFAEWTQRQALDQMSWLPVVTLLKESFTEVEIVDFGEIAKGQNEFIAQFLARVDPSIDLAVNYRPTRNASISGRGLTIALAANPHLRTRRERKQMREFLQRHYSNTSFPRPELFSEAETAELLDRYRDEYSTLVGS